MGKDLAEDPPYFRRIPQASFLCLVIFTSEQGASLLGKTLVAQTSR